MDSHGWAWDFADSGSIDREASAMGVPMETDIIGSLRKKMQLDA
jgi:hypothetical protein